MLLVLVEERLDPLVLLEVGQLGRVRELEESRGQLHQPLGVDGRTSVHVLFGGLEKKEEKSFSAEHYLHVVGFIEDSQKVTL